MTQQAPSGADTLVLPAPAKINGEYTYVHLEKFVGALSFMPRLLAEIQPVMQILAQSSQSVFSRNLLQKDTFPSTGHLQRQSFSPYCETLPQTKVYGCGESQYHVTSHDTAKHPLLLD
jgi:hypothetical protein